MKKLLTAAILISLVFTGCINENNTANTRPQAKIVYTEICDAIDKDITVSLTGEPYKTSQLEEIDNSTAGCRFSNTEDDPLFTRNFNIIVRITEDEATAASEYQRATAVWRNGAMVNKKLVDIADIGTKAFWAFGKETTQFITYQDDTLLIITFGHIKDSEETLLSKAKNIATIILNTF